MDTRANGRSPSMYISTRRELFASPDGSILVKDGFYFVRKFTQQSAIFWEKMIFYLTKREKSRLDQKRFLLVVFIRPIEHRLKRINYRQLI